MTVPHMRTKFKREERIKCFKKCFGWSEQYRRQVDEFISCYVNTISLVFSRYLTQTSRRCVYLSRRFLNHSLLSQFQCTKSPLTRSIVLEYSSERFLHFILIYTDEEGRENRRRARLFVPCYQSQGDPMRAARFSAPKFLRYPPWN